MSTDGLRPEDLAAFAAIGIPARILTSAGVRRVTHQQARDECGIRYKSDHLEGIAFPYLDPDDDRTLTWRVRRDNPEVDNSDGKPLKLPAVLGVPADQAFEQVPEHAA